MKESISVRFQQKLQSKGVTKSGEHTCERDGHFVNLAQFHYKPGNMEFPSVVLTVIFSFLEIEDLVRAARVCKEW